MPGAAVESAVVRFRLGRAGPTAGGRSELSRQSARIRELLALASAVGAEVQFEVVGRTDQANLLARNDTLSRERALFVRNRLVADGADSVRVTAIGVATAEPLGDEATEDGRALNRSVTIRVHLTGVMTEPQQ